MKQHCYLNNLLRAILCCLVFVYSCKKSEKSVPQKTTPIYDFYYKGFQGIDSTISFWSTAPRGSNFLWNFGDSTYSSDSTPVHIYENDGTFVISLIVNGDIANTIKKTITITAPAGSEYTYNISGIKKWHHVLYSYSLETYDDTSFAIQIINKTTLKFGYDTMKYQELYIYNGIKQLIFYVPKYNTSELTYYVNSDSIVRDTHFPLHNFIERYSTFK